MKIIFSFFMLFFVATVVMGSTSKHPLYISELQDIRENITQISAHYRILSQANYTEDLKTYHYKDKIIRLIDHHNPEEVVLKISSSNKTHTAPLTPSNTSLPWWSKHKISALLKQLDFSKVDGTSNAYQLNDSFRLTLLANQGHWGKVYALEKVNGSKAETLCAVKLLLTRSDRSMATKEFHERHAEEIKNNLILAEDNLEIAVQPYGIIKNDDDHYLLFLEYGNNASDYLKTETLENSIEQITDFMQRVNKLHLAGYAHGDLKIENMLLLNQQIKLCDWFSLNPFQQVSLAKYRYIGDNLPPEAIRAFYFKKERPLTYALVTYKAQKQCYFLHPIAADRFCLGISLLEIIAPDLYNKYQRLTPSQFDPYQPDSLDFWPKHVAYLEEAQTTLRQRAEKITHPKIRELFIQVATFIDLDPMQRQFILN